MSPPRRRRASRRGDQPLSKATFWSAAPPIAAVLTPSSGTAPKGQFRKFLRFRRVRVWCILINSCQRGLPKPPGRNGSKGAVGRHLLTYFWSHHHATSRGRRAARYRCLRAVLESKNRGGPMKIHRTITSGAIAAFLMGTSLLISVPADSAPTRRARGARTQST